MTVSQVAAVLEESPSTVVRRIREGGLPAQRIEGRKGMYLVNRDDVNRLIADRLAELQTKVAHLEEQAS